MHYIIYLVAFLEGFTTLSVEIVALRKFTPIIGSNSISTSIILGVILLALSYGYYKGGQIAAEGKKVKSRLVTNLLFSSAYYFFLTFIFIEFILEGFLSFSGSYFLSILFSSIILFFIPVFLASQTIPLLGELLKGKHSGEKMGKLLFYSTIGSFVGSVSTSVVFFPWIGVTKTAILSSLFLVVSAGLVMYCTKKYTVIKKVGVVILFSLYTTSLFHQDIGTGIIYSKANSYHTVTIYDTPRGYRIFSMDDAYSSGIIKNTNKSFFQYIQEVEQRVIESQPKNILVIGAAGFTFPNDIADFDFIDSIDVVDVDPSLKDIAEEYFLEKKLSDKITFYPQPSRFFLNNIGEKKYDFVLVDVYSGQSLPPQVLTQEFFQQLDTLSENIYLNIIADAEGESKFSQTFFSTLHSVFGDIYFLNTNNTDEGLTNFIISTVSHDGYNKNYFKKSDIYIDDKYSIENDLFQLNQDFKR
ncbi:MAG: hypothetical protein GY828_07905 [Candidatus Gracilibacteria bacterium]|nr:hypothetical protein [Candidatus Gracilibacteria bacterium]